MAFVSFTEQLNAYRIGGKAQLQFAFVSVIVYAFAFP
jgi:hypothetical protein